MASRLQSYLRTYRKRSGLTQEEVAFLLGCRSGAKISRLERLVRRPNLEAALACQAIFGIPAHEIFPGVYAAVDKQVTERARLLFSGLAEGSGEDSRRKLTKRKRDTLRAIAAGPGRAPANV